MKACYDCGADVEVGYKAEYGFLSRRGHNDAVYLNLSADVYGSNRFGPSGLISFVKGILSGLELRCRWLCLLI